MKKSELEKRINRAFENSVPDVLDNILSECAGQKDEVTAMTQNNINSKKSLLRWAIGVAAAFAVIAGGVICAGLYQTEHSIQSTVMLDVNPSIELEVNKNERVLAVNPLNDDGKIIIGDMNFEGCDINVAVNALVGSMLKNGYLSELSNSILVSVNGNNSENSAALQEKLEREISEAMQSNSFRGAVVSQTVTEDEDLKVLADLYGISLGKAQLIRHIVDQNTLYTFEELSKLSVNELNLLRETAEMSLENVNSTGTASDKAYIGGDKAKEIAFAHAGITAQSSMSDLEIEMDYEDNAMIYEVSFFSEGSKYNYDINALTGDIVKVKINPTEDKDKDKTQPTVDNTQSNTDTSNSTSETSNIGAFIGADKAKELAFAHAGITAENGVSNLKIETDYEHDAVIYEVSFFFGGYKYNYDINAVTGEISEVKINPADDKGKDKTEANDSSSESNSQTETENEDDAEDKEDKDNKADKENKEDKKSSESASSSYIGETSARNIVLSYAGVSAGSIAGYKCDIYAKGADNVYKIKFISNGYEYSCDVNAVTGAIVKFDKQPEYDG